MVLTETSEDHDVLVVGRTARSRIQQLFLGLDRRVSRTARELSGRGRS